MWHNKCKPKVRTFSIGKTVVTTYIAAPWVKLAMAKQQRVWLQIRTLGVAISLASFANITHFDGGLFLNIRLHRPATAALPNPVIIREGAAWLLRCQSRFSRPDPLTPKGIKKAIFETWTIFSLTCCARHWLRWFFGFFVMCYLLCRTHLLGWASRPV